MGFKPFLMLSSELANVFLNCFSFNFFGANFFGQKNNLFALKVLNDFLKFEFSVVSEGKTILKDFE